jgi:uncharacterized damage-inducible protein DinB
MTPETARHDLMTTLEAVSTWLTTPNVPEVWNRPQGEKWTLEQEFAHLLRSTYGIIQLYGEPARANWRLTDSSSRTYDEIVAEYREKLKFIPPNINANVAAAEPKLLAAQAAAWQQTLAGIAATLPTLSEADLRQNTVWKHPLIGPVTGIEMLYFSTYHTTHHLQSLERKSA